MPKASSYWIDTAEGALEEAGITATDEQMQLIAGCIEGSVENYHSGPPIEIGYDAVGAVRKEWQRKMRAAEEAHDEVLRERERRTSELRADLGDRIYELRQQLRESRGY